MLNGIKLRLLYRLGVLVPVVPVCLNVVPDSIVFLSVFLCESMKIWYIFQRLRQSDLSAVLIIHLERDTEIIIYTVVQTTPTYTYCRMLKRSVNITIAAVIKILRIKNDVFLLAVLVCVFDADLILSTRNYL